MGLMKILRAWPGLKGEFIKLRKFMKKGELSWERILLQTHLYIQNDKLA